MSKPGEFTDVNEAITWAIKHGTATLVDNDGVVRSYVSFPRDECLSDEASEWKARAEKAEAALQSGDLSRQLEVLCRRTREKWARHALRYRRLLHEEWVASTTWIAKNAIKTVDLTDERDAALARVKRLERALVTIANDALHWGSEREHIYTAVKTALEDSCK